MPWNSPAVANTQEVSSAVKRARSAGFGRSSCVRIVKGTRARSAVAASDHRPPAGEQRQCPPPGRADEGLELVEHSRLVAGMARVGQVGGAIEQRVLLVVEGAADVEQVGPVGRQPDPTGEVEGHGGGREDRRSARPDAFAQDRGDVERRHFQPRVVRPALDPGDVPDGRGERGVDVVGQRGGRLLGPHAPLVGLGHVGLDRPERGQEAVDGQAGAGERVGQR